MCCIHLEWKGKNVLDFTIELVRLSSFKLFKIDTVSISFGIVDISKNNEGCAFRLIITAIRNNSNEQNIKFCTYYFIVGMKACIEEVTWLKLTVIKDAL